MWMDYLTGTPRSTQLLAHKNNQVVIALKDAMAKYEHYPHVMVFLCGACFSITGLLFSSSFTGTLKM